MSAVIDVVRVLFEPTAVFARVRERPQVLAPLLAIVVASFAIGYLSLPYMEAALGPILAQIAMIRGQPTTDPGHAALTQVILATVGLSLVVPITAAALWLAVSLFGGDAKYATLLSVASYSAVTDVLKSMAALAVLALRGLQSTTSPADLSPPFGLDLLAPHTRGFLGAVLSHVNVFSVWAMYLYALGITTTHRVSGRAGYGAAVLTFVTLVLFLSGLALLRARG